MKKEDSFGSNMKIDIDEEYASDYSDGEDALELDNDERDNTDLGKKDTVSYEILEFGDVLKEIEKNIEEVAAILHFRASVCRLLLILFKWNKEDLLENFYDSFDPNAFLKKANILIENDKWSIESSRKKASYCEICCSYLSLYGLACGHRFCTICWSTYLTEKIMDEGMSSVACPAQGCSVVVDEDSVLFFVEKDDVRKRYQNLIVNSFVECSSILRWCPAPNCGRIIKVSHAEVQAVKCKCNFTSCFGCANEWHEPVNCRLLKLWLKKCSDDSETGNWISANTKECPKCQITIEKDGGCNHMTCKNASCKMEFCWTCLGSWEPHGSAWYSCNRYDDSSAKKARDAQEKSRAALQRYLHYYNRFMNHQQSLRLESRLYAIVKTKMEFLQRSNMSWIEVQFLRTAVDILSDCRRTLMYTYAFAFYLVRNNQTQIFEENQRDLEHATEELSEFLERDLPKENFVSVKQKVQDKSSYVEKRKKILLDHCKEGFEQDFWIFSE